MTDRDVTCHVNLTAIRCTVVTVCGTVSVCCDEDLKKSVSTYINRTIFSTFWKGSNKFEPVRTGSADYICCRTADRTNGSVLHPPQTLNRTSVRFSKVQVRTTVLDRTRPSLIGVEAGIRVTVQLSDPPGHFQVYQI